MEIEKSYQDGDVAVLRLVGRLNMVAAPRLKSDIDQTVAEGRPRIAGLKKSRQASGDLRITGVTQQVATVLQLTNLDKVLRAHPSVEAATDGW